MMKKLIVLCMFAALPLSAVRATVWQVNVADFQFSPAQITIQQGDTVIWTNTNGLHNVRHLCDPSVFGNSPAQAPWTYQFVFNVAAGYYPYQCDIHPDVMQGGVTVQARGHWNVTVRNFSFTPRNITITQGDTVTWNAIEGTHNVHHNATPSLFGNSIAAAPWTYSFVFSLPPDSFPYVCQVHSSMTGSIKVLAPLVLPAPAGVVASSDGASLDLAWPAVCGAAGYQVYRSQDPSADPFAELVGTVAGTSYSEPLDPAAAVRYFYQVRAVTP